MRQSTQEAIDRSIERLGGEVAAADPSSSRAATTADANGGREEPSPVRPAAPPTVDLDEERLAAIDVGWLVWLGDPEGDMTQRKWGIVVDGTADDKVIVLRSHKRRDRTEAWLEAWPVSGLDPVNSHDPGSSKRVQAAKAACEAIAGGKASGRWDDRDEELLVAIATLTAPFSAGRRSA